MVVHVIYIMIKEVEL